MMHFARRWLAIALAIGAGMTAVGCCGTTAGPTAPAARYSDTLAPGELRFYDADIPASTTQIDLDFTLDSTAIPVRLRQIDPTCLPAAEDNCQSYYDGTTPPRPAGVLRFGSSLQPHGARTRIVLQNMSPSEILTYSVTITPHRAGCT